MTLKYLQPIIDLLVSTPALAIDNQPGLSQNNIVWLTEKEKQYNIHIPASIAEWFSLDLPWDMGEVLQTEEIVPISEIKFLHAPQTESKLYHFMLAECIGQGGDNLFFEINGS